MIFLNVSGFFGTLFGFFVERIKNNLHIILSMDPRNELFQIRCESNPALYIKCNIQWWDSWSPETFRALPYLQIGRLLEDLPNKEIISKNLVHIHESCGSLGSTPKQFITLIETYRKIYEGKRKEALEQQSHLMAGLNKLNDASSTVDQLGRDAEQYVASVLLLKNERFALKKQKKKEKKLLSNFFSFFFCFLRVNAHFSSISK